MHLSCDSRTLISQQLLGRNYAAISCEHQKKASGRDGSTSFIYSCVTGHLMLFNSGGLLGHIGA